MHCSFHITFFSLPQCLNCGREGVYNAHFLKGAGWKEKRRYKTLGKRGEDRKQSRWENEQMLSALFASRLSALISSLVCTSEIKLMITFSCSFKVYWGMGNQYKGPQRIMQLVFISYFQYLILFYRVHLMSIRSELSINNNRVSQGEAEGNEAYFIEYEHRYFQWTTSDSQLFSPSTSTAVEILVTMPISVTLLSRTSY